MKFTTGDISKDDAEALVNTVNCVGVMGRGIALQFKKSYPDNFKAYEVACKNHEVQPGRMLVHKTGLIQPKYIINFPTKRHWKDKSRIEDIDLGLKALVEVMHQYNIRSIAIPPLGCGLGGLNWSDIKPRIERALSSFTDVHINIYEPEGAPLVGAKNKIVPTMTNERAALVRLIQEYLNGLLDPVITLIEVHKLMYFMQEAGEPLKLNYEKGYYGPYAKNLRYLLSRIEGHFISGFVDGGDVPTKELTLLPGAIEEAGSFLKEKGQVKVNSHISRVAELVEGFESPFGLELLGTVHWVAKRESAKSEEELVKRTYGWNSRKKQFSKDQIHLAFQVLMKKNWL